MSDAFESVFVPYDRFLEFRNKRLIARTPAPQDAPPAAGPDVLPTAVGDDERARAAVAPVPPNRT